ncbi:MAG: hypothetical protein HY825_16515 [Acidobacteria bacterium]|nr:hypothetical protein [Acidobacteriota bacterium]
MRGEIERRFVVVHVNYSKENKNPAVLERLGNPDKLGFPVLVVLSPTLEVLHTQETGSLETGHPKIPGHDPVKVIAFARAWGPGGEH